MINVTRMVHLRYSRSLKKKYFMKTKAFDRIKKETHFRYVEMVRGRHTKYVDRVSKRLLGHERR